MPDEDKTFSGSFVLDFRIWWRQAHTFHGTFMLCSGFLRPSSDAVLHMSRIECKWAKSFVLPHLHSIRLMWSTASELGLSFPSLLPRIWSYRRRLNYDFDVHTFLRDSEGIGSFNNTRQRTGIRTGLMPCKDRGCHLHVCSVLGQQQPTTWNYQIYKCCVV